MADDLHNFHQPVEIQADDLDGSDPALFSRLQNWREYLRPGGRSAGGDGPGWVGQYIALRNTDQNIGATSLARHSGRRADTKDGWLVERAVASLGSEYERELLRAWYVWCLPPSVIRRRARVRGPHLREVRLRAEKNLQQALVKLEARD
jgi:hypothetical protein